MRRSSGRVERTGTRIENCRPLLPHGSRRIAVRERGRWGICDAREISYNFALNSIGITLEVCSPRKLKLGGRRFLRAGVIPMGHSRFSHRWRPCCLVLRRWRPAERQPFQSGPRRNFARAWSPATEIARVHAAARGELSPECKERREAWKKVRVSCQSAEEKFCAEAGKERGAMTRCLESHAVNFGGLARTRCRRGLARRSLRAVADESGVYLAYYPSPCPSPRKLALASLHLNVSASASGCGWRRDA